MRLQILLIFLLLSSASLAQLNLFRDPASGKYGLRDSKGNIALNADYDAIDVLYGWHDRRVVMDYDYRQKNVYWRITRNGKCGLLDMQAARVLPLEYDKIDGTRNGWFIVVKDNKAVIRDRNNIILEGDFEDFGTLLPGYTFKRNGKSGLLDTNFTEVLPARYDRISECEIEQWYEGRDAIISATKVMVESDNASGVFDLKYGMVIPPTKDDIYILWASHHRQSSALYFLRDPDNRDVVGMIDQRGKWCVPKAYQEVRVCLQPLSASGDSAYAIIYVRDTSDNHIIINPQTNERAGPFEYVRNYQLHTLAKSSGKWIILDEHMNVLFETGKLHPSVDGLSYYVPFTHTNPIPFNELSIYYWFHWRDHVLYLHSEEIPFTADDYKQSKIGVLDYQSGKYIKPKYDFVDPVDYRGKRYYWARVSERRGEEAMLKVDVYDENMKLRHQFAHPGTEDAIDLPNRRDRDEHLIVVRDGDRVGARNKSGELVIPIEYTDFTINCKRRALEEWYCEIFYVFSDTKGRQGVIDENGELKIPFRYDEIETGYFIGTIVATRGEIIDIYNDDFEVILSDIDFFYAVPRLTSEGEYIYEKSRKDEKVKDYILIIGDEVWFWNDGAYFKVDQNTFHFEGSYLSLYGFIDIDRNGKFVKRRGSGEILDSGEKGAVSY